MDPGTFRLMNSEIKELTLPLAQSFHAMAPSPTERGLDKNRLKMLKEKAHGKLLISFSWARALLNGQWIRVNGQHSSQMLVELNGEFPAGLKVHMDDYEVADLQGLALLFRQFDAKKSGRTSADVAGAYQNIEPELQGVRRDIGKLAIEGVTFYRAQVEKQPTPAGDDQYTLFHEFALYDFVKWVGEIFSMKTPEMKSRAVVGAMYASFVADQQEAKKFWEAVARGGDQYDDTAASTVLDDWLKKVTEKEESIGKVTPAQVYQGCVYAYNAFRKGQTLTKIKYDFKIWQTPLPKAA